MEEIGRLLPAVFRRNLRRRQPFLVEILTPLWPRVAGKPLAERCRPVAFEAGTLTLAANCSAWTTELQKMTEEVRAAINSFLGAPVVRKLRVRYEPNRNPSQTVSEPPPHNSKNETRPDGAPPPSSFDFREGRRNGETPGRVERPFARHFARGDRWGR